MTIDEARAWQYRAYQDYIKAVHCRDIDRMRTTESQFKAAYNRVQKMTKREHNKLVAH